MSLDALMSTDVVGRVANLVRAHGYLLLPFGTGLCHTVKWIDLSPPKVRVRVREKLMKKSNRLTSCLKCPGDGCEGRVSNP